MEIKIALKFVLLLLLCFLPLLLLGHVFKDFSTNSLSLISQTDKGIKIGIFLLIAIFLISIIYSIISIVVDTNIKLVPFFLMGFLAYVLGFSTGPLLPKQLEVSLVSAIFILLGLFRMVTYIRAEYINSVKLKTAILLPKNIHSFLVVLGLVLSINFYFFFSTQVKNEGFKIPENLLNKAMKPAIALIEKNLETQISSQLGDKLTQATNIQDKEEMLKLIRSELEETFSEGSTRQKLGFNQNVIDPNKINITPTGQLDIKPLMENLQPALTKQVDKALEPYAKYMPILFAFSLFFILESVFSLFPFLIIPLISAVFFLLKKLKFIKLVKSTVEVERYIL